MVVEVVCLKHRLLPLRTLEFVQTPDGPVLAGAPQRRRERSPTRGVSREQDHLINVAEKRNRELRASV